MEHFTIHYWERVDNVSVYDSAGRHLVEFLRMKKGQIRRWNELQLTFVEIDKDAAAIEVELKPGASCFGAGHYRALREGLKVGFHGRQSLAISAWDPRKPEITLKFETANESAVRTAGLNGEGRVFSIYYRLLQDPDGEFRLLLDDLD